METIQLQRENTIKISRDNNGIPQIEAQSETDLYYGQGYAQAMDRGMQMLLTRVLGQGRGSEYLQASEEMLNVDIFFRKMNWSGDIKAVYNKMDSEMQSLLSAFADGIDAYFSKKVPWELKLLGYKYETWQPQDTIMIMRMIGYVSLQQSQGEMEHLLVELVQADVSKEKLSEIFPNLLDKLDIDLIKKVTLKENLVPSTVWQAGLPRIMASNNWIVAPEKSVSGKAILSNDPHLETNRLPNVWQEMKLQLNGKPIIGAVMPGIPGMSIGRTADLAWGATYTFMDAIDSWIEDCKDGKFKRVENGETKWLPFTQRKEVIKRKKKSDYEIIFYENHHGVLEGNPNEEGFYLATKWASGSETGEKSIASFHKVMSAQNVEEGMNLFKDLEVSFNWVFADTKGNIGYQMSGLLPKRNNGNNGLVPLAGWLPENDWQGMEDTNKLPKAYNPECGYFVTANNNLNKYGETNPINMPMGSYRADRIENILQAKEKFTPKDMANIQHDVYSLQAEKFMPFIKPLLPNTTNGNVLKNWDFCYDLKSEGAVLFERFYQMLLGEVFGETIGKKPTEYIQKETGIFIDFYANFDTILLSENSLWFEGKSREDLFRTALIKTMEVPLTSWEAQQKVLMKNILLGGKLPKFMGFDKGPFPIKGGRATPHQGQIYRAADRDTSFVASFRMIIDFGNDYIKTNICGGPSDRPFSKYYASDLQNWLEEKYKKVDIH